ncbi:ABC transporter substrate-binding protein [Bosea sp. (in: a-proteobacteria)]|uniref:ABC transporter substrate-binding protein n=1 Tax=Bosea sp. (in: a-proteobacteria) TaxID=1871050 RepID=UPI0026310012|nr:ABC transporter substrate-binding protein [Bosea sp. (in: a-proteobacteria)]MCO5093155.1 ABC transporter substrate-binding protein [Bosea sp. (in: a-proteobacteria)]
MRRRTYLLATAALAAALAATPGLAADPVKVGLIIPLSGGNSLSGAEVLSGVTLAIEECNAAVGPNGRQVQIIKEDDAGVPTTGASAAQKLIERDRVVAIIGSQTSNVATAIGNVGRKARVPVVTSGAASSDITETNTAGDPWIFRAMPGTGDQGAESASDMIKMLNLKRVAIIYDNSSYGRLLNDSFTKGVKALGGEVVAAEHYEQGEQDFYTLLTRVRETKPDGVFIAGLIAEGASILRQAHEINFKTQFYGSGGMISNSLLDLAGREASEGFAVNVMYEPNTNNPRGKAFGERFQKRFSLPGNTLSGHGFDVGTLVCDAVQRAKTLDGVGVRDALRTSNVEMVEGPAGTRVKFDDKGASYFKLGTAIVKNGVRTLLPYQ